MASSLRLRVVQARHGDCLILQNGYGKRRRHILIDGGPSRVYGPYLRGELASITAQGGWIDLAVLTHVDMDHVKGMLELFTELREARKKNLPEVVAVKQLWHNAFEQIMPERAAEAAAAEAALLAPPGAQALLEGGIGEGVKLELANEALGVPRNAGFPGGLVRRETARRPMRLASMKLWVLAPHQAGLDDLREDWLAWLNKPGRAPFAEGGPERGPEVEVEPDDSVNNLSSIVILAEAGGRTVLLTGDALAADVLDGLEAAGLMPPGGTFHANVLKVPHHGSARNCIGLFERVIADIYVLSADGSNDNPDATTLHWIADSACRQGKVVTIFATNMTPSLRDLLEQRPPESNFYRLKVLPDGQNAAVI